MAVVVAPSDVEQFLAYAKEENLEATEVAVVTEDPRLVLEWRGKEVVNISRAFLDTNGAHQETDVEVEMPCESDNYLDKISTPAVAKMVEAGDMNVAGGQLNAEFGEDMTADVIGKMSKETFDNIVQGRITFHRAFMTGDMTAKSYERQLFSTTANDPMISELKRINGEKNVVIQL